MPWQASTPTMLREIESEIEHRFGISHTTIQIEPVADAECRQADDCT